MAERQMKTEVLALELYLRKAPLPPTSDGFSRVDRDMVRERMEYCLAEAAAMVEVLGD